MSIAFLEQRPVREHKSAVFGTISLVCAVLAIALPVVITTCYQQRIQEFESAREKNPLKILAPDLTALGLALEGLFYSGIAAGAASLAGVVSGAAALFHRERSTWRPIVGLIVNVPMLVCAGIALFAS